MPKKGSRVAIGLKADWTSEESLAVTSNQEKAHRPLEGSVFFSVSVIVNFQ